MRIHRNSNAIVLIVVVGVLAVLSLLAATFGMLMSVEMAASRNQTESEMARQAAQAAAGDLVAKVDAFVQANGYMPADLSVATGAAADQLGTREMYRRDKVKVYTAIGPTGTPPTAWTMPLGRSFHVVCSTWAQGGTASTTLTTYVALGGNAAGWYVMQANGAGAGQFRRISSVAGTVLTVATAWNTPADWTEYWIIPSIYSGEFNLNVMGYAGDLGKENAGNYRTSFDASLRRLIYTNLAASNLGRLSDAYNNLSAADKSNVDAALVANSADQWAGILSDAIISWRNGPDKRAGNQFKQNHRPEHLLDVGVTNEWDQAAAPSVCGSQSQWSKLGLDALGGSTIVASTTWPAGKWSSAHLTFGSGCEKGNTFDIGIGGDGGGTLSLDRACYAQAGDAFCLYAGALTTLGASVNNPDATEWPNAVRGLGGLEISAPTIMTEKGVLWRVFDSGYVTSVISNTEFQGSGSWTVDHANCLVWLNAGTGAGQVRRIASTSGASLTVAVADAWNPQPVTYGGPATYTTYRLLYPVPAFSGKVTGGTNVSGNVTLDVSPVPPGNLANLILFIWAGPGRGQARTITGNDTLGHITLDSVWDAADAPVANRSYFGIERESGEPTQHNPLALESTMDDRLFSSVPDILPAIVAATGTADATIANNVGNVLYAAFRDCLTAAPARMPPGTVCINDWSNDGYDNNNDGTVDNEGVPTAQQLYVGLGLADWVAAGHDAHQAAQLVANIMDFRDGDSIPTVLNITQIPDLGATTVVYGAEGLHLTEVMCVLPKQYSVMHDGMEMTDDGGVVPDPESPAEAWGWSSSEGCWKVDELVSGNQPTGTWRFANLPPGVYGVRVRGRSAGDTLHVAFPNDSVTIYDVDTDRVASGEAWGYVRNGGLLAVTVNSSGEFYIKIRAAKDAGFYGFQLLPQFVEFTNAAATDIPFGAGPALMRLTTEVGAIDLPAVTVPGASADGSFPVNYGSLVVALGEKPYEKQWGGGNGVWGDTPAENYPVIFVESLGDDSLDKMLIGRIFQYNSGTATIDVLTSTTDVYGSGTDWQVAGVTAGMMIKFIASGKIYNIVSVVDGTHLTISPAAATSETSALYEIYSTAQPRIRLTQVSDGATIAGGAVDGEYLPAPSPAWSSIEKKVIFQPTYDTTDPSPYWTMHDAGAASLSASQNQIVTNSETPSASFRSNLNSKFDLWNVYPTLESASNLATAPKTLPIILNRPYPSPAWLGLVPTSHDEWRTVDAASSRADAEDLLGLFMEKACVGHDFAQININTAPYAVLRSVLPDANAQSVLTAREALASPGAWTSWDQLLTSAPFTGFASGGVEDSGANNFGDDFVDDSDEKEEWARRYSNIFTLHSQTMRYVVSGLVYDQLTDPLHLRASSGTVTLHGPGPDNDKVDGASTDWVNDRVLPGMEIIVYCDPAYRGTVKMLNGAGELKLSGALPTAAQAGTNYNYEIRLRAPIAQSRLEVELEQTAGGVVIRGMRYLTD